jgi:hypothetical protein
MIEAASPNHCHDYIFWLQYFLWYGILGTLFGRKLHCS